MTPTLRLLPFETLSGAANMAADEAMLVAASERGLASLRFYTWTEPTLSLGYFQPAAERLPGLPWVRRSSGGAALVHHHELTYALALPAGKVWHPSGESWICRMHHLIMVALALAGAETKPVVCGEEKKLGDVLCFLHQTPGDLLAQSSKVVGSAQRKQRGAMLQHGGILLARSAFAPQLPGLLELTGVMFNTPDLVNRLTRQFTIATGYALQPATWTDEEQQLRHEIERDKYANPTWNEKR